MRALIGPCLGAVLLLVAAGCAPSRPCQVIPMQIEIARYTRDQLQTQVDEKKADVARSKDNLELARTRLEQMQQEKADLEKEVADSAAAPGRKQ
jgi:hypothetical protein